MADGRMSLPMARGYGETKRPDRWWLYPLCVSLAFAAFIGYSTWAAFQNDHFTFGRDDTSKAESQKFSASYLSPFYSPAVFTAPTKDAQSKSVKVTGQESPRNRAEEQAQHAWFGNRPDWVPDWLIFFSPALLILPFPGLFRFTCYYYRGAYYKAVWQDPPNCAVGEPRSSYWGENSLPLILQNAHRYALYIAIIFIGLLAYDAVVGFIFTDATGDKHFGIGVGSFVLVLNVILLGGYTFGCHSFRHLIGGYKDQLASSAAQKNAYDCVSCLNRWHQAFAWCSLFWVGFSDFYVRMCSMGVFTDYRIVF